MLSFSGYFGVLLTRQGYDSARNDASESAANARMSAWRFRRTAVTAIVEQFPSRTQTTFGGCPRTSARCWKSTSLETITNPCAAADAQTIGSTALDNATFLTCSDPGNSAANCCTSRYERFWSKRTSCGGNDPKPPLAVGGKREAGLDIFPRQVRKIRQYLICRHTRGKVFQHVSHSHPKTANTRLSAALARLNCDEVRVIHKMNANPEAVFRQWNSWDRGRQKQQRFVGSGRSRAAGSSAEPNFSQKRFPAMPAGHSPHFHAHPSAGSPGPGI